METVAVGGNGHIVRNMVSMDLQVHADFEKEIAVVVSSDQFYFAGYEVASASVAKNEVVRFFSGEHGYIPREEMFAAICRVKYWMGIEDVRKYVRHMSNMSQVARRYMRAQIW